jgi:hypothetical protein
MTNLDEVHVHGCRQLAANWLSADSKAHVRILSLSCTNVTCVPEGLSTLKTLDISDCQSLTADCLPASSAARITTLKLLNASLGRLPEGVHALEVVDCSKCSRPRTVPCGVHERMPGQHLTGSEAFAA